VSATSDSRHQCPQTSVTQLADTPASRAVDSTDVVYASGRVIDVRRDVVVMPDGARATRDVIVHPGAVGIVALDEQDRVLLVEQYRHPVRRMLWEPPAGLLDKPDEPPLDAAKRELHEEAHYQADRWDVLVDAFTSPGMTDEAVRIYLAREIRQSALDRHVGENEERDMPVRWVALDEIVASILAGRMHNPMAVMGVLATAHARRDGFTTLRSADSPWPEMSSFTGSAG
jgi:8-oxo-dGTP pyrophosphatase MutT (NUDIX family)